MSALIAGQTPPSDHRVYQGTQLRKIAGIQPKGWKLRNSVHIAINLHFTKRSNDKQTSYQNNQLLNLKMSNSFFKKRLSPIKPGDPIDYKDVDLLKKFITDRGKILPRRLTGLTAKQQRDLTTAVKRARIVALLPFVNPEG